MELWEIKLGSRHFESSKISFQKHSRKRHFRIYFLFRGVVPTIKVPSDSRPGHTMSLAAELMTIPVPSLVASQMTFLEHFTLFFHFIIPGTIEGWYQLIMVNIHDSMFISSLITIYLWSLLNVIINAYSGCFSNYIKISF